MVYQPLRIEPNPEANQVHDHSTLHDTSERYLYLDIIPDQIGHPYSGRANA
jgi:hypothetical protein